MKSTKEEIAIMYDVVLNMGEPDLKEYRDIVYWSASPGKERMLIYNFFQSAEHERKKKGSH